MDSISDHYYKYNKTFLAIISAWPYDKKWSKQILRICICILLASGTVFQLTTCVKLKCTGEVVINILTYVIPSLIFLMKYVCICFKVEMIVYEFEQMERNWHILKDEQEITILKQYSKHSRLLSLVFAALMYIPNITFIFHQFVPNILDILLPLNESRPHKIPVLFEYFVDQEKYFYLLIIHVNLMLFMGTTAIVASETMVVLLTYHICAFFKIISYRLQFVFDQYILFRPGPPVSRYTAKKKLIDVIRTHRDVIRFGNNCFKSRSTPYFILLSLGIISISLCLYRLHQALSLMDDMPELLNATCYLAANVSYLFFTNFLGQTMMDHSTKIFTDMYCTPWYRAALPEQHILLFAMRACMKGWGVTIAGIFDPCYEGFAMIMRMAMSYFMALRSVQR